MATPDINQLFAQNRAEELGYDVWERFVIPPFFERLSIGNARKPKVIIGGRGCGKTMLLRYLSHESTFSPKRDQIPADSLSHIGLYWRADTQFSSLMQHREIEDDTWAAAFRHLAAIVLGLEVLRSLESISASSMEILAQERLADIDFGRLKPFSPDLPSRFQELRYYLEDRLAEFEAWANDVRSVSQPRFLPGDSFVSRMIALIREQVPELKQAVFFVYIDEYENLTTNQQRIINIWLKQSEPPLIFNLAMKLNGFKTRETAGGESLSRDHDYREISLEDFDLENGYQVFAAEIFLLRLQLAGLETREIDPGSLRDPSRLFARKKPKYCKGVLTAVKRLFPSFTQRELAATVLEDTVLRRRLTERVKKALETRGRIDDSPDELLLPEFPEASVIVPALLRRESLSIDEVKEEIGKLKEGLTNRFDGPTSWVHNNFVGCYLQLYEGLVRPCPFYGGFSTFCFMSRGNLRHFLELCHQALARSGRNEGDRIESIAEDMQADAARQVAADLFAEVRSFGPEGNNLHTFLLRLGSLFSLSQQSPTQSEPERTHFSILGGEAEIGTTEVKLLSEAVKWSVLFEERGTKKKSDSDPEGTEYILNPIYAPYFHISYRKRRKLDLSANDAGTLIRGSYDEVKHLLRHYQRKWSVDLKEAALPLFAHLKKGINDED